VKSICQSVVLAVNRPQIYDTIHWQTLTTLKMTSAQIGKTLVINNSSFQTSLAQWIIIGNTFMFSRASIRLLACLADISFPFPGGEIEQASEQAVERRSAPGMREK